MSSKTDSLHQSLARLRARLSATTSLDAEARTLLHEIERDIERLNQGSAAQVPGRRNRLETLAVKFEGEHPSVAAALREVVELLAQAGI